MTATTSTLSSGRLRATPSKLGILTLLIVTTVLAFAGRAQAQLKVSMMPSYNQNRAYANATLNQAITVWGRAWGGTAPYSYVLSFGDGTTDATGAGLSEATASKEISSSHTYTLGGSKTATLTVTDATGASASRSTVIRVIGNPTHEEKVNMAIEKGLLYLWRTKRDWTATRVYWYRTPGDIYGTGQTGASLLAFGENGHLASNDYVEDIYAEMMQKGINTLTSVCRSIGVGNQGGKSTDSNGNNRGLYVLNRAYANSLAAMAVNIAFPDAATAKATEIPAGERGQFTTPVAPSTTLNYYDWLAEMLDAMAYGQLDGGWKGWGYNINGGHTDGSTHQWPNMALLLARDRWGFTVVDTNANPAVSAGPGGIPKWVVDNSVTAFKQLTPTGGYYDGACGYSGLNYLSGGKTGGKLVGFHLGEKATGDSDVDRSIGFISRNWYSQNSTPIANGGNWPGNFYDMYAIKKGLSLLEVDTITTTDGVDHDWYLEMCSWLLGDSTNLTGPRPAGGTWTIAPSYRNATRYAFGQQANGGWRATSMWVHGSYPDLNTSHAILVLTQAVTIPQPVAIVEPVSVQPRNFAFGMDGSNSFHQDNDLDIVLYEWDWDASDGLSWESGPADASGSSTPTNPGYALPGFYTVTLRVSDNNPDEVQTDTATTVVEVTDQNAPPVAVPIPAGIPSYSGRIGDDITLDGSESFDPEGDPIILYDWDLDGDGVFGDAFGPNPVISFVAEYSGVIGLRVTSEDPDGIQKTSSNNTVIDIFASPSDLFVSAISADIIVSSEEVNVSATVNNAADSGKPFTDVVVRFYNGDPLGGGSLVGPAILVDLPIGGSASIGPINLTGLGGAETVYVYVDANEAIGEYNETNNTASVNVANNPPIAVAQNVTVTADADCLGVVSAADIDGGSSDPDGDDITLSVDPAGPYELGETEVTLTVSDGKVSDSATAIVSVVDETPPALTCPDDIVVDNDAGECGAKVSFDPSAEDNCSDVTIISDPASGSFFDVGTTTVLVAATDAAGNISKCEFTVTVRDAEHPTITCPEDIVVGNDPGECGAVVRYETPVGKDNCPDPVTVLTEGLASGAFFPIGTTQVTYVVTDASGNSAKCSFKVTVNDTEHPTITCPDDIVVSNDPGECGAVVRYETPVGKDNCPDPVTVLVEGLASGKFFPIGTTAVTYEVTDGAGNRAKCTFRVTVRDTEHPTITCPDNIVVENDPGECGAVVRYETPVGEDNCPDPVTVLVEGLASGKFFPIGTTQVTYEVTDASGNRAKCTFTVTVNDTEAPTVVSCPADEIIECPAVPAFGTPVFADNCGVVSETSVDEDLAVSGKEVTKTKRTWTATDAAGNSISCSQVITVQDTTNPVVVSCPADELIECPTPVVFGTPVFSDTCDTDLTVTFADEDLAVSGKEVTKTKRTWTATDNNGNSISCSQVITSQDTTDPVIECPADVCIVSDAGSCDATNVDIGFPVVSDTCDSAPVVTNDHASSTYPLGDTVVTWTVTDHKGNSASCTQTITVLASVAGTWRSPLAGQPVANKIRVGQVVPHKIDLADCTGVAMTDLSGITVTLQIVGVNAVTGDIFQEVLEDAQGVGVDGTLTSDGLMEFKDDHWHFNVDTGNFDDPDTAGSDNHYISTVTITDNATLKILGTSSVTLETAARGGGKKK